ncbi:MAG: hypothetical protein E7626_03825 [Ruminococcaceae bacterium]|nr:hypothetical protein [Oscillospiraceae bacterium]
MTFKYIGMLLIFICSTLIGNGLAIGEKRRIERSDALRELVHFIYREIECFRTPLDEIYLNFSSAPLEKSGFIGDLRGGSLEYAIKNTREGFCFSDQTKVSLVNFAENLGKSEYSDQLSRCKYILSLMDGDIKKSREAYPKNRKMYTSLGLLSGVMIIILMI